jgi:hypothetical protein
MAELRCECGCVIGFARPGPGTEIAQQEHMQGLMELHRHHVHKATGVATHKLRGLMEREVDAEQRALAVIMGTLRARSALSRLNGHESGA